MKVKLNLTIDEKVAARSKRYAARRKTSVSKLVQELLEKHVASDEKSKGVKSFSDKYAGSYAGLLSDEKVKKIKDEYLKKKYGY